MEDKQINMSYFPDLTEYTYNPKIKGIKNIGWLAKNQEFTKGEVDINTLNKLKSIKPNIRTKGIHPCEFCYKAGGSSEIWVSSKDGQIYSSPSLIVHYIEHHGYLPPKEFLDAIIDGYTYDEPEFKTAMKFLKIDIK